MFLTLDEDSDVPWYLSNSRQTLDIKTIFQDSLSFLVLYNYIIPISLYVTLELQKFCGSMFLVWDLQLYYADGEFVKKTTIVKRQQEYENSILFQSKDGN